MSFRKIITKQGFISHTCKKQASSQERVWAYTEMNSWECGKIWVCTCVLGPQLVIEIIFKFLFLSWRNATKTTYEDKQMLLLCGLSLSTQVNYCNNFIAAPSLVLGLKATIQHLFPFCLVDFGPIVLPRGEVIHAGERRCSLYHREPELETREA